MAADNFSSTLDCNARPVLRSELCQLMASCTAVRWSDAELRDDLPLGADGVGLDSIAIVELLVGCEKRWGTSLPVELLEQWPLTVGTLLDYLQQTVKP